MRVCFVLLVHLLTADLFSKSDQEIIINQPIAMSKDGQGRVRGGRGSGNKSAAAGSSGGPVPYSTITRRERSRKLAQKRRDIYKQIMDDMTNVCLA